MLLLLSCDVLGVDGTVIYWLVKLDNLYFFYYIIFGFYDGSFI